MNTIRMSFGDHLEELRTCLIRALAGIAVGTVLGFVFGKPILGLLFHPLLKVQYENQLQPHLQALSPTTAIAAFLKIAFLSGLLMAMPWVLHQLWRFIAAGLYDRERRFVEKLVWPSVGLFIVGVLFLYLAVLPVILHFFIAFNRSFPMPEFPAWAHSQTADSTPPAAEGTWERTSIRVVPDDPPEATVGDVWINSATGRLVVMTSSGPRSTALEPGNRAPLIQSQFTVDAYISFVLTLALAFGVAFETPIVVFFLAWSGLVATKTMAASRRYVILIVVVVSAIVTPTPDVLSQLLLAVPMYLLFEIGILAARLRERGAAGPGRASASA
jgi:sec-independent protein translocase protein TatC